MGTTLSAATSSLHPVVGANTILYEIPVIIIVVVLLVIVLVMNQRKKKPAKPAKAESPQSYYADLQQPAAQPQAAAGQPGYAPAGPGAAPDQFGGFATAAPGGPPPPAAPAAPAAPASPPPGTPAGWLPDPGGAPNTLRYWDGNGWTQHVAARS